MITLKFGVNRSITILFYLVTHLYFRQCKFKDNIIVYKRLQKCYTVTKKKELLKNKEKQLTTLTNVNLVTFSNLITKSTFTWKTTIYYANKRRRESEFGIFRMPDTPRSC